MKFGALPLFLFGFLITGCVSTKNTPIVEGDVTHMDGQSVLIGKREAPGFGAMTAGKAMFGALGGAAMISAGNKIVQENDVQDPAIYIANSLASNLSNSYGLKLDSDNEVVVTGTSSSKVAKTSFPSDYLLDVQTVNWSFAYFPTDWNNYRVIYSAKIRLIRGESQKVVAEGFCSRVPEEDENAPSYDELLANNAERLKSELRLAADHCISEFSSKVLKI